MRGRVRVRDRAGPRARARARPCGAASASASTTVRIRERERDRAGPRLCGCRPRAGRFGVSRMRQRHATGEGPRLHWGNCVAIATWFWGAKGRHRRTVQWLQNPSRWVSACSWAPVRGRGRTTRLVSERQALPGDDTAVSAIGAAVGQPKKGQRGLRIPDDFRSRRALCSLCWFPC